MMNSQNSSIGWLQQIPDTSGVCCLIAVEERCLVYKKLIYGNHLSSVANSETTGGKIARLTARKIKIEEGN